MATVRHFTATGFIVHQGSTLLHWHAKVKMWLPPGGHIEENEDPVQAVLREIHEETGVQAEVVPTGMRLNLDYQQQVHAPFTIVVEDIDDPIQGYHQHIDMIYFCRLVSNSAPVRDGWLWVSRQDIADSKPLVPPNGSPIAPPEDVRVLASHAFEIIDEQFGVPMR